MQYDLADPIPTTTFSATPPVNNRRRLYIIIGAITIIAVVAIVLVAGMFLNRPGSPAGDAYIPGRSASTAQENVVVRADGVSVKECKSNPFIFDGVKHQLVFKIPVNWSCSNMDFPTIDSSLTPDYVTTIQSNDAAEIQIVLGNLGRGSFCGVGSEEKCKATDFYIKKDISTKLERINDEGEIYGVANVTGWVSIKYKDIATIDMTAEQKKVLTDFLDSIEVKNLVQ